MKYPFPSDLSLNEVRSVIARHNERTGTKAFIEAHRGDHVIFNYVVSFNGAFPAPTTEDASLNREFAILRECRGLTFRSDGQFLTRKFQKFFNVNEKDETQAHAIDWSQPHKILEKLDGSMITPLWLGDMEDISADQIRWCTKMGLTDVAKPVEEFVLANPHYARWAATTMYSGYTPIFEWCSRQQKIVIDYPDDRLVLLAIRNNATGEYLSYETMLVAAESQIDVVRALDGSVENIEQFMAEAKDLEGTEGYIVRFDDGHMVKAKGAWYMQIHRTKDLLQLEKDVLQLIVGDRLDDAKSFMDEGDRDRVDRFHADFINGVTRNANRISEVINSINAASKRDLVLRTNEMDLAPHEQGIMFRIFDGHDPIASIMGVIEKHIHTGPRVETIRHLMGGLTWDDYLGIALEE